MYGMYVKITRTIHTGSGYITLDFLTNLQIAWDKSRNHIRTHYTAYLQPVENFSNSRKKVLDFFLEIAYNGGINKSHKKGFRMKFELTLLMFEGYHSYEHEQFEALLSKFAAIKGKTDEGVKRLLYREMDRSHVEHKQAHYLHYNLDITDLDNAPRAIEALCTVYGSCLRYLLVQK